MTTELWGVGQPLRGDDGAGVFVASRLARRPPEGLRVRVCETVPDNYLALLLRNPPELLLVVDAVSGLGLGIAQALGGSIACHDDGGHRLAPVVAQLL